MSNARNLANLLDSNGDVKSDSLDNVPASDVVNDTTPQLGGNLDTNGNAITGSTVAINSSNGEFMISATENGPVALRYDNNLKLTTKSDGVDITGELQADSLDIDGNGDISGNLTLGGNLNFGDNNKAVFGAGSDLQIYHDGGNSIIKDAGTGHLYLLAEDFRLTDATVTQTYMKAALNGAVELRHSGDIKFATTSTGIDVTGSVTASTSINIDGTDAIKYRIYNGGVFKAGLEVATSAGDMSSTSAINDFVIRGEGNMLFAGSGGTERMRINSSGNVGIGTDSPSYKTHIRSGNSGAWANGDNDELFIENSSNAGITIGTPNTNHGSIAFADNASSTRGLIRYDHSTDSLRIDVSGSEKMRIDSSGNVGIGTTDIVSNSAYNQIRFGSAGNIQAYNPTSNGNIFISEGAAINSAGSWEYLRSDFATYYRQGDGTHTWATAASGTDGNTATFTERMRINTIGNVGIGTNSPSRKLSVYDATQPYLALFNSSSGTGASDGLQLQFASSNAYLWNHENGFTAFGTNNSERMRIDSSGNVGIGTSSPQVPLNVAGVSGTAVLRLSDSTSTSTTDAAPYMEFYRGIGDALLGRIGYLSTANKDLYLFNDQAANIAFGSGGTERMRINSSGNVGIGNTGNSSRKLDVTQESGQSAGVRVLSGGSGAYYQMFTGTANPKIGSSHNTDQIEFYTNGTERMRLETDGDLHVDGDVIAYSTTVSDERLKENIQPIEHALQKVKHLKGCTFTYTVDGKESAGLIAQDVEKVLPSAVSEKELPLKQDDGIAYKTLQYDQTIGLLVEAIKELTAKVEELENR